MDGESLQLLEIEQVLKIVGNLAHTVAGRERIEQMSPLTRLDDLQFRLELLREALEYTGEQGRWQSHQLPDCRPIFNTLKESAEVLNGSELRDLLELMRTGARLTSAFDEGRWPRLTNIAKSCVVSTQFIDQLDVSLNSAGDIREEAYPELRNARRKQSKLRGQLQEQLERYLKGKQARYLIPEPFITQRADRYVIPVLVKYQNEVPGIIHDVSSSGGTVFMEPLPSVQLNNQLLYHRQREVEIIHQVLESLTDQARTNLEDLIGIEDVVTRVDEIFSIAEFAERFSCIAPEVSADSELDVREARHPLLVNSIGRDEVVPVSLQLSRQENILVISGPNTGGKTVALKTAGLLSLMAHFGLPVPAGAARIPFLSDLLVDIGDRQSIQNHLSTFSGHILRINDILKSADEHSLVILDEVGRGTDPTHGSALAIAVVEELRNRGALVIVSTHHQLMKSYAASASGVRNASVLLDPETLIPNYRIQVGVAGESSGFQIARQLGFPEELLEKASESLTPEQQMIDRYLQELREEKIQAEKERELVRAKQGELDSLKAELIRRNEQEKRHREQRFEESIRRMEAEYHSEVKEYVKRLKDRFDAARVRQETGRKAERLKETFRRRFRAEQEGKETTSVPAEKTTLKEGDTVYHKFFKQKGVVISIGSQEAVIEMNGKRVTASPAQLQKVESRRVTRRPSEQITLHIVEETDPQLNLIGKRIEEAMPLLDKFLDRAFVAQLREVQVVHGFGTGRLKSAVAKFLNRHPHVENYRLEGGVTVVELATQADGPQ